MSRLSSIAALVADSPAIWHADALASPLEQVLATGHAELDAQLPGGGWPIGAMVEILQVQSGLSEWRLLLPALARSRAGPVVLVGAPHMPFGPALAAQGLAPERLLWVTAPEPALRMWACEQALRCAEVAAVLAWLPQSRGEQLRRLHLGAAEHSKLLFVMRPASAQADASPAVLRLRVSVDGAGSDAIQLEILKRRGPPLAQSLRLPARHGRLAELLARSQGKAEGPAVEGRTARVRPLALVAAPSTESGHALDRTANTR